MQTKQLDRAGTVTSMLCAVHCAAAPFLLPLLPFALGRFVGPALEASFAGISLILGVWSLGHSFRAVHRDVRALALFAVGFTLLMAARFAEPPGSIEPLMVGVAAALIVAAHTLNLRLVHRRGPGACPCPCHDATVFDSGRD
jgi:hypothetical protein